MQTSTLSIPALQDEIRRLAKEKDAIILGHNYQVPEVQDVADYVADSLGLSRKATEVEESTIVFCGVHFMAETAAILNSEKRVLIPDLEAGCSLASTITADQLRAWKEEHPGAVVVSYVNTTAEVKAESDICCTSSNAVDVVNSIPTNREILFLPDMFLGTYVERMTGRNLHIWMGECHVHAGIRPHEISARRAANPGAELLIHPECGCVSQCLDWLAVGEVDNQGTHVLSTGGMLKHVQDTAVDSFVVATETGILHGLRKQNPDKKFVSLTDDAVCEYMKKITLEKLYASLSQERYEVRVDEEVADKARIAIERMLRIG